MSHVRLLDWPAILRSKNFNVGHYTQTFQPVFFIPAMLKGSIDFYHFMQFHWPWPCLGVTRTRIDFYHFILSLTLTLLGDHKDSTKWKLLASFSCTLFNLSGWNVIWCWSNSNWTSSYYFWARFSETRERTAVLLTASKNLWCWHVFRCLWIDLLWIWCDDRWYWTVHFDTTLPVKLTVTLIKQSMPQECEKAKTSAPIISQSFQLIWM